MSTKWKAKYDYETDYNDHFETPRIAYEDILPLLDGLDEKARRKDHALYDPYYCNGRAAVLLSKLGFHKVIHRKRDFYKDVQNETIPDHDVRTPTHRLLVPFV